MEHFFVSSVSSLRVLCGFSMVTSFWGRVPSRGRDAGELSRIQAGFFDVLSA